MKDQTFSENLKSARKTKGHTQESIAEKLGISAKRYAKWEEGRSEPSYNHLTKLCELLEVDDLYLFISKELAQH